MICHQFEPYIVDLARDRAAANADVDKHLRACEECTALFERERTLSAGLRRLVQDVGESQDHEAALLMAFDAARTRRPSPVRMPIATGLAAAAVVFALVLTWHPGNSPEPPEIGTPPLAEAEVEPHAQAALAFSVDSPDLPVSVPAPIRRLPPDRPQPIAAAATTEFVAWPGAAAWPPFESGELIRVELMVDGGVVEADVLVGQDGFARAVRLVQ